MPDPSADRRLHLRAAADLRWLQQLPPLYRFGTLQTDYQLCLSLPDRLTPALRCALENAAATRLGRYCELLFEWGLSANPQIGALRCGQIVRVDGRTLGEFDFLIRPTMQDTYEHLELSVKFYLGVGAAGHERWIGINPSDRLERKLARMQAHQIRLAWQPTIAPWLAERGLRIEAAQGLMLGMLFFPLQPDWRSLSEPDGVTPPVRRGWWCHAAALQAGGHLVPGRFLSLPRLHWLAPTPTDQGLIDHATLAALARRRPLMVSRRDPLGDPTLELDRGVVVPDRWPDRISPSGA